MPHTSFRPGAPWLGPDRGFGLVELMIVIAMVTILSAIALPSYSFVIRNSRITSQTNDFLTAINFARNESITRSRGVTLCAADTTGSTLPTACGNSADWDKGWMVFIDDTVSGAPPTSIDNAAVLRTWRANEQIALTVATNTSYVRFNPRGLTNLTADLSFTLKPSSNCSGQQQRGITISALGRSSSSKETCS